MEPLMTPLMAHFVLRNGKTDKQKCSPLTQNRNKNLNVQNCPSDVTEYAILNKVPSFTQLYL